MALSFLAAVVLAYAFQYVAVSLAYSADFSKHPPEKVFQMAMGHALPRGVSELRVAGRHYFNKRWVWMRCRANDEAIRSLTANRQPFPPAEAKQKMAQTLAAQPRYVHLDQRRIGWGEIKRITKPEVYEFYNLPQRAEDYTQSGGWTWMGYLVVDRKNHRIYVHALGD